MEQIAAGLWHFVPGLATRAGRSTGAGNPTKKRGPALLPAPTAPSMDLPVFASREPEGPHFSILTHQLRRRFRPGWIRGSSLLRLSPHPEGWLASRRRFAAARRLWHPDIPRPFLGWPPSRGLVSLGGKPPSQRRDLLFRRLLPTGPGLSFAAPSPRGAVLRRFSHPSPAGGDRTFRPFLTFRSLPTLRRGWDFRPDHRLNMRTFPSRAKRNLWLQACG